MSVSLKPGVRIQGVSNEALLGIFIAASVAAEINPHVVLTSVTDGRHSRGSEHYKGDAWDMRTRHLSPSERTQLHKQIKAALGGDFDIILETDHLHCEYDPKEAY